eukprot:582833_1
MSDSDDLLFGNITDANAANDCDDDNPIDGTTYPKHLHIVALDSDESDSSDSLDHMHSPNHNRGSVGVKKCKSKTKLDRDRSRKRLKEMATNGALLHDSPVGDATHTNLTCSKPKKYKKKGDHHMISAEDSEDETDDEDEEDDHIMRTLISDGHHVALILTLIVFVMLLIAAITGNIVAIILFILCYCLYLGECYVNKTWKEMNDKESGEGNVKLLDTLRKTPPVIDLHIECYHYESNYTIPSGEKNTIVWVHGKTENAHYLDELGLITKCFKWDWNGINFIADKENQSTIAAVVLPSGFEGKRIQGAMLEKLDDNDCDGSLFFEWNGDMKELLTELKKRRVIEEEKQKVVSNRTSFTYDYEKWNDISAKYPIFNTDQVTRLNITKTYCFENEETQNDFNEQKQAFMTSNNKDEFQSVTEHINILGFRECITIRHGAQSTPFWHTIHGYWICSVLLFTLYPRYKYVTIFATKNWKIVKSISI